MQVTHEPWLVALSLIVAIQGAYVGLSLAVQVGGSAGLRRRLLLAGAAFSFAVAIWSMHFVGMLAARLPFPVDYLVFPTLLSFLVCVLVVGAAVFAVSAGPPTGVRLATAATAMGGGIVIDALHRNERAARERSHAARGLLRRREHGHRDRRVRPGALARGRPRRPPAAAPLGDRARCRDLRHALHRDGRLDRCTRPGTRRSARPRCRAICSPSWSPSSPSAFPASSC